MAWGEGVDPSAVLGKKALEDELDEASPEGQHMFPELADFMASVAPAKKPQTPGGMDGSPIQVSAVRYKVFSVDLDGDRLELETLMTRLAQGQGCVVCREESTFTKEGRYMIALKWMEYTVKTVPAPELIRQNDPPGEVPDLEETEDEASDQGSII